MANFGETLKRERELRKISLREVSEATKIGLKYLEAMEGNRFDQLPGGLFNKGFIRAYAKFIGLDGETLVNVYLYDVAHRPKSVSPRERLVGLIPDDSPLLLPAAPAPIPVRHLPVKLITGVAAALIFLGVGGWLILSRPPGGAAADPPPPVDEPPLQQAGLLRPAPFGTPAVPEPATGEPEAALPLPDPQLPTPASPPAAAKAPPIETDMALFLATSQTTSVTLWCDSVEKVSRDLSAGETIAMSCVDVLLSAGNAGALLLKINGRECLPLGEVGAPLEDFPLNARRAMEICPPEKGAP
ncbi:MAG: helix-turn-helix domain-containing protein [Acidobacteria bacterium]|nr:helix-turn-helix domain-containing protein [Acidobacteriota bacterium]